MADGKLIDLDSGLKRVGGNMTLFKRLLGKYVSGTYITDLETHLAAGEFEAAAADAHTVKGVAANLSLTAVNEAALEIEQSLKNGVTDVAALVEMLKNAHNKTLTEIESL